MPGKRAALEVATSASTRARRLGVANTWSGRGTVAADCTDVDGVAGALRAAGVAAPASEAVLLGAGGTASAAVGAMADLGTGAVTVVVRDPGAPPTPSRSRAYGMGERAVRSTRSARRPRAGDGAGQHDPGGCRGRALADRLVGACRRAPWCSTRSTTVADTPGGRGGAARPPVATGLDMLLHAGVGQVEQFTGARPAAMMHGTGPATGFEVRPP